MRSGHRADIEGLRAVAVLLVLLYHAGVPPFGGGFLGVDVFFVISGFLITGSLLAEAEATGTVRLASFYARRARRLLPAAAVVIGCTAVAVRVLLPPTAWREFGGDLVAASAYVLNWRLAGRSVDYLAEDVVASPVQHFWSLSIEEQFYFVWPGLVVLALWLVARRGWQLRRVMGWLLLVVVAVPSLWWSVVATGSSPAMAFFDTGTRLWELALGGLVAIVAPALPPVGARAASVVKAVALGVLVVAAVVVDETAPWPGSLALVATLPTAVLLGVGARPATLPDRLLSTPVMVRTGAWSYSLYLWHWPPLALLAAAGVELGVPAAVGVTLLSVVPAGLSFHLLENPVRFQSGLRRSPALSLSLGLNLTLVGVLAGLVVVGSVTSTPSRPATTVAGGAGAGGVATGAAALPPSATDEQLLDALEGVTRMVPSPVDATDDIPVTYEQGCHVAQPESEPVLCTFGVEGAPTRVALVGDSKAAQWLPAVAAIAEAEGWELLHLTKSACSLATAVQDLQDESTRAACRTWVDEVLDLLAELDVDTVLVSSNAKGAHAGDGAGADVDVEQRLVDGMVEAYRRVEADGAEVVVLLDNPEPSLVVYECVARNPDDLAACAFERRLDSGGRASQQAAVEQGGFAAVETADLVCPTETCVPVIGGVLVYRQGSHITDTYVRTTTPMLAERLVAALDD